MKPNPTMQVFDKNLRRTGTLIDCYSIQLKRRISSDYEIASWFRWNQKTIKITRINCFFLILALNPLQARCKINY